MHTHLAFMRQINKCSLYTSIFPLAPRCLPLLATSPNGVYCRMIFPLEHWCKCLIILAHAIGQCYSDFASLA